MSKKMKCVRRAKTIRKGKSVGKCLKWATKKAVHKKSKSAGGCRDSKGAFVPVSYCTGRRK